MSRMLRNLSGVALLVACTACGPSGWPGEVVVNGSVREVLRDGRTEGRVDLATLRGDSAVVAVGALEGLAGEYTSDRGELWVSRPASGVVTTTKGDAAAGRAAMVLSAHVAEWRDVPAGRAVDPADLDDFIHGAAATAGLDDTRPFPFLVEGTLVHLDAHVIAGACPMRAKMMGVPADPPPAAVARASVRGRLVGFFAEGREGEMTHHGSRLHLHVLLDDGGAVTAHVESVGLGADCVLRLPAR